MSKKKIYPREYQIGTCFLYQKCFSCDETLSFKHCKYDLNIKIKNTKKRKSYSRVYDSKTKNRIYNDLQLSELNKADRIYLYEVDFSQKFNYCLCSICHNLMTRLKKSQPQLKTFKSNHKSQPRLTRLIKKSKSDNNNKVEDKVPKLVKLKLQKLIVSDDDEVEEINKVEEIDEVEFKRSQIANKEDEIQENFEIMEDVEQDVETEYDDEVNKVDDLEIEESESNDNTLIEISFKLVIKKEGKSSPAKWKIIHQTNFDNFIKDLYLLIQDQIDELVLYNDYIILYK